jgi:hypothetical protein
MLKKITLASVCLFALTGSAFAGQWWKMDVAAAKEGTPNPCSVARISPVDDKHSFYAMGIVKVNIVDNGDAVDVIFDSSSRFGFDRFYRSQAGCLTAAAAVKVQYDANEAVAAAADRALDKYR